MIYVLLILSSISISMISGNNGIINNAITAKEQSEVNEEKEQLDLAVTKAMNKNKYGDITQIGLNTQLEEIKKTMPTSVDSDEELNLLYVTFNNSGRVYQIDSNGNVTYLGNKEQLKNSATITASPESDTTPQLVQYVDLKIETFVGLEDDKIFVHYAWTNSENKTPSNTDYAALTSNVNSNKKRRTATLTTEDTAEGNYYLWVQLVFNENTITKKFGPYAIKDHTTLVATNKESAADSGFLGNTEIPRNKIRSITIKNSFGTHSSDETSWDVSASKDGRYLAWSKATTDATDGTYYDVVIEGKGGVVANTNASWLFAHIGSGLTNQEVTITGLEYLDTGLTTNMERMFQNCKQLTNINISNFDTKKVTTTFNMFSNCTSLTNLDVTKFNTSNVINMSSMFSGCSGLTSLDVTKFDTNKVTTMSDMFQKCSGLTSLDVSKFNTSSVTNMQNMFNGCSKLTSLDVTKFDTSSVTNMQNMFNGCSGLTSLDVTKFNTSNVTNMQSMFSGCSGLTSLDVTKFNTSNVINMQSMFYGCSGLTTLDITKFDTSSVNNMSEMFGKCSGLKSLNVTKLNTQNVTNMGGMFYQCSKLTELDVSKFNTNKVTSMANMFFQCNGLVNLSVDNFATDNTTIMSNMFAGCSKLTSLNLIKWNTQNVTNMSFMFRECNELINLDLSNFNTENVTNMGGMFYACRNLKTIYIGDNWNILNVNNSDSMFSYDWNLVGGAGTSYSLSNPSDKTYAHIDGGVSNPGYFTAK